MCLCLRVACLPQYSRGVCMCILCVCVYVQALVAVVCASRASHIRVRVIDVHPNAAVAYPWLDWHPTFDP